MVAELTRIPPQVEIQTIFALSEDRSVNAVPAMLDNKGVQTILGKAYIVPTAVFCAENVGILMNIRFSHLSQLLGEVGYGLVREGVLFRDLLPVGFRSKLSVPDAILFTDQSNAEKAVLTTAAIIEELRIRALDTTGREIQIVAVPAADNFVA